MLRRLFRTTTNNRCRAYTIHVFDLRALSPEPPVSSHPIRRFHQQEDCPLTAKVCLGVYETRKLGQHHAPLDHTISCEVVRGVMQQAPPKRLSNAVATPRMFVLDPSTWDSLASSMVAAGTAGARAETSPPLAGGYRQGEVGGGNGGRTQVKKSGDCQECGHHKGGWSQVHPGPLFG